MDSLDDLEELEKILYEDIPRVQEINEVKSLNSLQFIFQDYTTEKEYEKAFNYRNINWNKVIVLCNQGLENNPKDILLLSLKAEALSSIHSSQAIEISQYIISLDAYNLEEEFAKGEAYFILGKYKEALQL